MGFIHATVSEIHMLIPLSKLNLQLCTCYRAKTSMVFEIASEILVLNGRITHTVQWIISQKTQNNGACLWGSASPTMARSNSTMKVFVSLCRFSPLGDLPRVRPPLDTSLLPLPTRCGLHLIGTIDPLVSNNESPSLKEWISLLGTMPPERKKKTKEETVVFQGSLGAWDLVGYNMNTDSL
jgi:hypothetical protein